MTLSRENAELSQAIDVASNVTEGTLFIPQANIVNVSGTVTANTGVFDLVEFNNTTEIVPSEGQLTWDTTYGTLDIGFSDTYALHVGQETHFRARNETGGSIYKGQAVYATGVHSDNIRLEIDKYTADGNISELRFIGLVSEDIGDNGSGYVTNFGYIRGNTTYPLDTRGNVSSNVAVGDETWAQGDILYVHPSTAGKLTKVAPKDAISVAIIIRVHQTDGVILVRPTSYGHITDLHDVSVDNIQTNDMLVYNAASGSWINTQISDAALQGIQGITGSQGVQGLQGLQGVTGSQGGTGLQGVSGTQGTQGIQGLIGSQGATGSQGTQGTQGTTGIQGIDGSDGAQGIQGITGSQGTNGSDGAQGIQGVQGTTGTSGPVAGSANQVVYKNASNVASGSANFTFQETNAILGIGNLRLTSNSISATNTGGGIQIIPSTTGGVNIGRNTTSSGFYSSVGGGYLNCAIGHKSRIGGGYFNTVNGEDSVIAGGGPFNTVSAYNSSILGGSYNVISARFATIGGGHRNIIQSPTNECCSRGATIGGGVGHNSSGGTLNATTGNLTGTITCCNAGAFSTISGGLRNCATGNCSTVGGGSYNTASANYSTVGGGYSNIATNDGLLGGSTVSGGIQNYACGYFTTVSGGYFNTASGCSSTVGGGGSNSASASYSTVGGGRINCATQGYATVGGGCSNTASGFYSIVSGGYYAKSAKYGELSHAAGRFSATGDAQHSTLVARKNTTDATANQVLFLDGSSARLTIPAETTWMFSIKLAAHNDTNNDGAWWTFRGGIRRDASNNTSLIGSIISEYERDTNMATATASVVADDTNEALEIRVTGVAAKNIRWVAVVDISQVSWGTP